MGKTVITLFLFFFSTQLLLGQVNDSSQAEIALPNIEGSATVQEVEPHSPKKATLLSVFIPGAGQVYNKKWWKVPIIYGGMGAAAYAVYWNRDLYHTYRDAYRAETDGDTSTTHEFEGFYDASYLEAQRNYYRGNMEISYVILGSIYVLQIIDASVDAHLMSFDVSDNLSMHIDPYTRHMNFNGPAAYNGLKLTLNFTNAHSSRRIR